MTPNLDAITALSFRQQARFYHELFATQHKDAVLVEWGVPVDVPYQFLATVRHGNAAKLHERADEYYGNRLCQHENQLHNPPSVKNALMLDVALVEVHEPVLQIMWEFRDQLALPTAVLCLCDALLNRLPAFDRARHWMSWHVCAALDNHAAASRNDTDVLRLYRFVETFYLRFMRDYLHHRVLAAANRNGFFVTTCDAEVVAALAEYSPFLRYRTRPVKALYVLSAGATHELTERGETLHPEQYPGFPDEPVRSAVETYWRQRKLRLLCD